ncbi:MAG: ABC transporter ATP-binding protein [Lachnospiraceae bacterium]|nr:ABC transporter ATP-binding protein [Lachnospiraceae bacterium]MCD7841234.1 ABC transporter ATP-binding protein [Lachnospiraceae bacterium]
MSEEFLKINDLVVEYSSGGQIVQAVNGVNLTVQKGKTLGLVGETGAGKTTIAKSILRILPTPPAKIKQGEIFLDGQDLLKLPEKEMMKVRGNRIAMIFQDPMTALNPTMTVGDQISEVVLQHNDYTKQQAQERTIEMLELVGIASVRYMDYPHQFSGGMKQRVVIAMALACNPELILADEPTTALDVTIQAQVLDMMRELREKFNTSMILITHDLGVVAETCDDVAVIYAGEIVEYGTREHIFRNPQHPYTLGLFGSLPKLDDDSKRLSPIHGLPPDPTNLPEGCKFGPRCPECKGECGKDPAMVEIEPGHFVRCCKFTAGQNAQSAQKPENSQKAKTKNERGGV